MDSSKLSKIRGGLNPYVGPPFLDAIDAVQQSASLAATNKSRATIKQQTHVCSPVPIDLFDYNLYIPISAQSLRSLLSGAYLSFTFFSRVLTEDSVLEN